MNDLQSDLKVVCRFLQNSNDDKKLEKMLKEHREEFEDMEEDTYDLIGTLGNMAQVKEVKDKCKKEDGGYNMCKGMDDWLKRKENEGQAKGIKALVEICEELGVTREETFMKLKSKFQDMKEEQVEEYLNQYWRVRE